MSLRTTLLGGLLLPACVDAERLDTSPSLAVPPLPNDEPSGTAFGSTLQVEPSAECLAFVACVVETQEPALVDRARAAYGEHGQCWQFGPERARSCTTRCADGLAECDGDDGGSTGEEPPPPPCSIDALAPGAESRLQVGDGPGDLPPAVGAIMNDYCSCHTVDPARFDASVPAYFGALQLHTWDDFQRQLGGEAVHSIVRRRVVEWTSMPPVYFCGNGDVGSLPIDVLSAFDEWLTAGAPDAPHWPN